MTASLLKGLRTEYHRKICCDIFGHRGGTVIFSNADNSSKASVDLARGMADRICQPICGNPPSGQLAGSLFTRYTKEFLDESFKLIQHIRPGEWSFSTSQSRIGIASFHQYEHLAELKSVLDTHTELKAALGGDYLITPDIIVSRSPVNDNDINGHGGQVVSENESIATLTPLRSSNYEKSCEILHASISCKWTMRSDRAQNTRTEALNLVRNRKGRTPCILAVTFEPLPSRIASIALGTGDIDCTYHGALYELVDAAKSSSHSDSYEMLQLLIQGRRLRDISDIPFDLAI
ncbi:type II restriction endonuclease NgoMIV [Geomonas silvestris]|uniref:Type II restriction endonuclease NgoMIV n=1 Tax=Geomonas silvestris TaxID=2740184 RepID=A0A6V8MPX0_9BACT|nr:NgoMIV family type II restriction endonuclease [Geomonas silvestris]GFO61927.1 type II restriction endonuclease NgoMIV [Geomonas silvestris]